MMRRQKRPDAEIDMAAFSDIAFLLIIFFILTTTFQKPFGRQATIPSGTTDTSAEQQDLLSIGLKGDEIFDRESGESMSFEKFQQLLADAKFAEKPKDKRSVVVQAADNVPYQTYFRVLTAIDAAGAAIALEEEDKGDQK